MNNRYDVSVWWGEPTGWKLRFKNVPKWRLRWRPKRLRNEGWDNPSILVQRVDIGGQS